MSADNYCQISKKTIKKDKKNLKLEPVDKNTEYDPVHPFLQMKN